MPATKQTMGVDLMDVNFSSALALGMIWPPIEGRLMLQEATLSSSRWRQEANGDWCGVGANGWLIQSPANGRFRSVSAASSAMIEWVRAHSAHSAILGGRRCMAVSEESAGGYRLWQCVSVSTTLCDLMEQASKRNPRAAAETLIVAVQALVRARTEWQDVGAFPLRTDTVTLTPQGPRYAHFMPYPCPFPRDCDVAHAVSAQAPVLFSLRISAQEL